MGMCVTQGRDGTAFIERKCLKRLLFVSLLLINDILSVGGSRLGVNVAKRRPLYLAGNFTALQAADH